MRLIMYQYEYLHRCTLKNSPARISFYHFFCSFLLGWRAVVSHSEVLYYDTPLKWILCSVPYKAAKAIEIRQIRPSPYPQFALASGACNLKPLNLGINLV